MARSWVAITLVRSSAPPGGTAGCSAQLVNTPAVVERAPQQRRLPVVADQHRDDRRHDRLRLTGPGPHRLGLQCPVAERAQPVGEVAGVVQHRGQQRRSLGGADDAQRRQRGAERRGHRRGGEQERAAGDAQVVDHVGRPGHEAAAGGERLGEGAHAQVDPVLDAEQLGGPRAAGAQHAGAVGLVDHQARAVARAQLDDVGQRGDVALHREDAVDHHEHAAAVASARARGARSSLSRRLWRKGRILARESRHAVEDRGVVARVDDHRVAGAEQRAERADVGLVAGGEHDRVLGVHPLGELALELQVQGRGAVEQARAGQAGAVAVRARRGRPASRARRRSARGSCWRRA